MNGKKVQEIFGKRAEGYVKSASHADKEVLERVGEMCGDLHDKLALDVATGTGHVAMHLAPAAGTVIGLDLTRRMLEVAREEAVKRSISNIAWLRGDVRSLPFPDGSFHAVTCRRAPHHFPDINKALKEMARVLKDDGVMVIDDRSVPDDPEVDRTMNHLDLLHDRSHVREYGRREWEEMLGEAGLANIEVREYRRHLALSTMTWNAEPSDAKEIERVVSSLSSDLKGRMAVEEADGKLFIDQYYIAIRATK
ncbi:MAG TPA: methyltransferase domain-containing protein [Methanomassiliicoccales archaeon]|nr:methyltransferase domain-containing protein [Methanomassiliicoccales archaeon]